MRKIDLVICILGLLILACSSTSFLPTTPTPPLVVVPLSTEMPLVAASPTPSVAPTQVPPTFTATSTFMETSTVALTDTTVPTNITAQAASPSPTQPTPQGPVFDIVTTSGTHINWGGSCAANSVTVTVQVANGFDVTSVLLFTRLLSQTEIIPTRWNAAISLHNDGLGTFTYDLAARGIAHSQEFQAAWVQYQLVAVNSQNQIVGRTQIYLNNLTVSICP